MKLVKALPNTSANEIRTAGYSHKNTGIRKRLLAHKLGALNSVVRSEYSKHITSGLVAIKSEAPNFPSQKWVKRDIGIKMYHKNVTREAQGMFSVSMGLKNDLIFGFMTFYNSLNAKIELSPSQSSLSKRAIQLLQNSNFTEKIVFKYSIEKEILYIKSNIRGMHYLVFGDENNDVSYGFVGKEIGEYSTTHLDSNYNLEDLVSQFING